MLSLKRKTPIEQQNEVKDIPVNSINFMTDDENSDDEESPIRNKNPPSVKNLLLATLSSDSADIPKNDNEDDCDITCCSLLENDDLVSNAEGSTERYKKTPSLFSDSEISNEFLNNSLNFPLNENNVDAVKKTSTVADTVVGAFTDQDLMSSRLSELRIQECSQNKIQKATSMLADTVSSSFTDQDLMFSRLSELRIHGHTQNNRVSIVADTVLGPFTDEDLAYSHSFVSDSALSTKASKNEQNLKQKMKDVITTDNDTDVDEETASELDDCNNEASDHDESSSEEEVISILDSDEELNFSADPPLYNESDSFVNCSTVGSKLSSKTSTLPDSINTFFNNPPPVKSDEITVSHTMIRDFRNNITGFDKILDAVETSIEDRFVRKNDLEDEEVIIDESVEISETSDTDLEINKQNTNHTSDTVATDKESTYKNDEEHDAVIESEDISTVNSKIENQSTQSDKEHRETLRIKGRIKLEINFKIYHSSSSNSSNNSSNKSTTSSEPSPPKDPPRKNNHDTRARSSPKATPSKKKDQPRSKLALGKAGPSSANKPAVFSENKLSTPVNKKKSLNVKLDLVEDSSYKTPLKDNDIEIDEGLEEMLNTLYGEEWKTPSLLQSCKSRKFQKAVRKSMALFNFGACK